jgi:predicted amidohydrolase YtcJ
LLALALAGAAQASEAPPDLVLLGGKITTEDPLLPQASALAVRDGRIVFVGGDAEARRLAGPHTRIRSLRGRRVLPGLVDAHIHALDIIERDVCSLKTQARTLAQITELARQCIRRFHIAPGQWLAIHQWNFSEGNEPDARHTNLRRALDLAAGDRPIMLSDSSGHHGGFNSAALARAANAKGERVGLSRATLQGDFAGIQRLFGVDADGEPDGNVAVSGWLPMDPPDDLVDMPEVMKAPQRVVARLNASGITAILDAAVRPDMFVAYDTLQQRGQLTVRANLAQYYLPESYRQPDGSIDYDAIAARARALRERYAGNPLIRADVVKVFVDGVLEGNPLSDPPTLPESPMLRPYLQPIFTRDARSRAHLAGYVDTGAEPCRAWRALPEAARTAAARDEFRRANGYHPGQCTISSGVLEHDPAVLQEYIMRMHREGFTIHAHAIGDRAVRLAIDALEAARAADGRSGVPDAIAHAQLVAPEDVERLGRDRLGLAMTFAWAEVFPDYDLQVIPFVDRVAGDSIAALHDPGNYYERQAYPTRALWDAGAIVAGGSDAPVDTRDPRPFVNLQMAVTRAAPGLPPLNARQALSLAEAVQAYTLNGARLLGREDDIGSLQPGKSADFVVLDRDIFAVPIESVGGTRVLETWFQGRKVYFKAPH